MRAKSSSIKAKIYKVEVQLHAIAGIPEADLIDATHIKCVTRADKFDIFRQEPRWESSNCF